MTGGEEELQEIVQVHGVVMQFDRIGPGVVTEGIVVMPREAEEEA